VLFFSYSSESRQTFYAQVRHRSFHTAWVIFRPRASPKPRSVRPSATDMSRLHPRVGFVPLPDSCSAANTTLGCNGLLDHLVGAGEQMPVAFICASMVCTRELASRRSIIGKPAKVLRNRDRLSRRIRFKCANSISTRFAPPNGTIERTKLQAWLNFFSSEMHKGGFSPLYYKGVREEWKDVFGWWHVTIGLLLHGPQEGLRALSAGHRGFRAVWRRPILGCDCDRECRSEVLPCFSPET
jgi:hypothetical protein